MSEVELPDPDELEERRDKTFSRRVALLTAIYAVVLAFASLGGANALEDSVLNQQQAPTSGRSTRRRSSASTNTARRS